MIVQPAPWVAAAAGGWHQAGSSSTATTATWSLGGAHGCGGASAGRRWLPGAISAALCPVLGRRSKRSGRAPGSRALPRGGAAVAVERATVKPPPAPGPSRTASFEQKQWAPQRPRRTAPTVPRHLVQVPDGVEVETNCGFMFLKPHANTQAVRQFMDQRLRQWDIEVVAQGDISAEDIARDGIIDKHYGTLAAKALHQQPGEHAVTADAEARFLAAFGLSWRDALDRGLAVNAREAMARLGLSDEELDQRWTPLRIGVDKVKLGGGFYCGSIGGLYVINGFYMAMRTMYVEPGTSVHWYSLEWNALDLPWQRFRAEVLGDTDPATAGEGSLRGGVHRRWRQVGLKNEPHIGENVVHASASPFEAVLERANWTRSDVQQDPYFEKLRQHCGFPDDQWRAFSQDPVVMHGESTRSLFDLLEDLDSSACMQRLREIAERR